MTLYLLGSIDGVNSNAPLSWMRYNVNQNLSGTVTIKGSLEALDFRQDSWIVNRVRLDDILSRAIRTNEPRRFSFLRFRISFYSLNVDILSLILIFFGRPYYS